MIGNGTSHKLVVHCLRNRLWTRSYAANKHMLRPNQPHWAFTP